MTHTPAELRKIVEGAALTKREVGILHSASRKCGLSYRAAIITLAATALVALFYFAFFYGVPL